MINHARTLLMNVPGPKEPTVPGDAYVPVFAGLEDSSLNDIRQLLFEAGLDYAGTVYRVAQYMSAVHATEYAAYATDLDSRITYDPDASGLLMTAALPDRFAYVLGAVLNDHTKQRMLFGDAATEPYKTFYNLTFKHFALPYRISGIVLAFIYRLEALRTHV